MLVIERKFGEKVIIGDNIILTVMEMRSGKVRLAFEAPRSVTIDREEVYEEKKAEREKK
jgi:carbon storage regulator